MCVCVCVCVCAQAQQGAALGRLTRSSLGELREERRKNCLKKIERIIKTKTIGTLPGSAGKSAVLGTAQNSLAAGMFL